MIVTYSRNVFIPLTRTCRNSCHYCGFRKNDGKVMERWEVERFLASAKNATEALFTFGERPDENDSVKKWLGDRGYERFVDYVYDMNRLAISHGLLPHTNAGVLERNELKRLREVNASMGLMLEQAVELECHSESPGKKPEVRIKTIKVAGKLQIPFTTGILIGIGENREDRMYSLEIIADLAENYGHIQEVIIQNFSPKPGTKMEGAEPPSLREMIDAVRCARELLPERTAIQVPPNLVDSIQPLISAGANDIGGISEVTPDYINPEHPWPQLKKIERSLNGRYVLRERLPIHPVFVREGWYGEEIAGLIEAYSDDEGYRCLR